ncbi:hypothetical protein B0H14DRAFT_2753104 [Mycena olivaceomarginata]|nr:hypothetical protein B0H14DRAFT_2753104 [Mycena olivaceomarginata]
MQTLCRRLKPTRLLGGSFFFKRNHATCGNARMLFATLAYQLALHGVELRRAISRRVKSDPSILGRGMDVQLHALIVEPCKALKNLPPLVVLIDGLDECEGPDIQREILCLLRSTTHDHRLRFLIASRPESHIRSTFERGIFKGIVSSTNVEQSFEDIRIYFLGEFARIHHDHPATMRNISTPWPSPQVMEKLVENSSGYFIYAATVIKFIDDEYSRPPKQLELVLQNLVPPDSESPFEALDKLYIQILMVVRMRNRPRLCDILSVLIHCPASINIHEEKIEAMLGLDPGDAGLILRPLRSVLELSTSYATIHMHHASFRDFLRNQERSADFYVGSDQHRTKLALSILDQLLHTHRTLPFHWTLPSTDWLIYMASIPPSADFVPRIQLINPDFVFCERISGESIQQFLLWLKKIDTVPKDLIQRWEDYQFMQLYEHFQSNVMFKVQTGRWMPSSESDCQKILRSCRKLLPQSPHLIRFLQITGLLIPDGGCPGLLDLRVIVHLSWEDIRGCICSLRPLVTGSDFSLTPLFCLPRLWHELDSLLPVSMVSAALSQVLIAAIQRTEPAHKLMDFW